MFAGEQKRGGTFGLLAVTTQVGSIVGGMTVGPMVDRWGYLAMFAVLGKPGATFAAADQWQVLAHDEKLLDMDR